MKNNALFITTLLTGLLATVGGANAATSADAANRGKIKPAVAAEQAAENTLQQKVEDERGELLATQPGRVEINESDSRAVQQNATRSTTNNQTNNRPLLAGESYGNVTPADQRTQPAPITLQERVKDRVGELEATQPGEVEVQERRSIRTQ